MHLCIHVCMQACMNVSNTYSRNVCKSACRHVGRMYASAFVCPCVRCMHICMACMQAWMNVRNYECMQVYINVAMYWCMHARLHVCMKVYACVCMDEAVRLESCRLMEGSGGFANLCPGVFGGTSHFVSSSECRAGNSSSCLSCQSSMHAQSCNPVTF